MSEVSKETLGKVEEYENVRSKIDKLKDRKKELKQELEQELEPETDYMGRHGKLVVKERSSYNYSDTVKQKKDEVKELKKKEKAEGIATEEKTPTLYYYSQD